MLRWIILCVWVSRIEENSQKAHKTSIRKVRRYSHGFSTPSDIAKDPNIREHYQRVVRIFWRCYDELFYAFGFQELKKTARKPIRHQFGRFDGTRTDFQHRPTSPKTQTFVNITKEWYGFFEGATMNYLKVLRWIILCVWVSRIEENSQKCHKTSIRKVRRYSHGFSTPSDIAKDPNIREHYQRVVRIFWRCYDELFYAFGFQELKKTARKPIRHQFGRFDGTRTDFQHRPTSPKTQTFVNITKEWYGFFEGATMNYFMRLGFKNWRKQPESP